MVTFYRFKHDHHATTMERKRRTGREIEREREKLMENGHSLYFVLRNHSHTVFEYLRTDGSNAVGRLLMCPFLLFNIFFFLKNLFFFRLKNKWVLKDRNKIIRVKQISELFVISGHAAFGKNSHLVCLCLARVCSHRTRLSSGAGVS